MSLSSGRSRVRRCCWQLVLAICLVQAPLWAVTVGAGCPAMPPELSSELDVRASALLAGAGVPWATIRLECEPSGVWLVWFDGSRALVDQSKGFVPGALALIESRLAKDRQNPAAAAAPPAIVPPSEPTPWGEDGASAGEDTAPATTTSARKRGAEGGIGLAMMTELWSGTSAIGTGPRLDVSIGLPGPFALLIGEGALFGVGPPSSTQIVMFDLQGGIAWGAPFSTRTGLGAVMLFGVERMSATGGGNTSGLWKWTGLFDMGLRGSLPVSSTNLWLGADLILRTDEFQTGRPNPIKIPATSFLASIGCFLPAFGQASQAQ